MSSSHPRGEYIILLKMCSLSCDFVLCRLSGEAILIFSCDFVLCGIPGEAVFLIFKMRLEGKFTLTPLNSTIHRPEYSQCLLFYSVSWYSFSVSKKNIPSHTEVNTASSQRSPELNIASAGEYSFTPRSPEVNTTSSHGWIQLHPKFPEVNTTSFIFDV